MVGLALVLIKTSPYKQPWGQADRLRADPRDWGRAAVEARPRESSLHSGPCRALSPLSGARDLGQHPPDSGSPSVHALEVKSHAGCRTSVGFTGFW